MELQILVSKKGTKVVKATHLHQILQLLDHHYAVNVKKWLNDVFEFQDGIRKPVKMQDYAPRQVKDAPLVEDYYFSLELAKLIVLRSKSKVKWKYAKQLQSLHHEEVQSPDLLTRDQVLAVLDLVKTMTSISCQEDYERLHLKLYQERNGSAANWWQHRADILGYSSDELREKVYQIGKRANGMSHRQLLMHYDKYEMIRVGVIDLFMVLGKSEDYARSMGDLAKTFARELQVEIQDDRQEEDRSLFAPYENGVQTVHNLQTVERAFRLSA